MSEELSVLVIDDDPISLLMIRKSLKNFGLISHIFTSPYEAINCYESIPSKIVMIDFFMPNLDGVETATKLEEIRTKEKRNSFFVGMSSSLDVLKNVTSFNFNDVIEKPVKSYALSLILKKFMPEFPISFNKSNPSSELNSHQISREKLDQLENYFELDADKIVQIRTIYENFFKKITSSLIGLHEAIRDNDTKNLIYHAHSLKNSSARMGADDVTQVTLFLETNAKILNSRQLKDLMSELTLKCNDAQFRLKQEQVRRGYSNS